MNAGEVWRDIPGYEGSYQASSLGRIRSISRTILQMSRYGYLMERNLGGRLLKSQKYPNRYLFVNLGRDNPQLVHRLVAVTFIPGDTDLQINHKNGDRQDNRVENLEWVTCSDNHIHAHRCLPRKEHALTRKVTMEKGSQKLEFNSVVEAANHLGVVPGSISSAVLRHHRCLGYEVTYV